MDDGGWLGRFIQAFGLPAAGWAAVCALVVHLVKLRNARLRDIDTEKSGDWERIRHERNVAQEERDLVRDRWAQCEAERIEWMGRAIKAEATLQGFGEWRQKQAIVEAAKRLTGQRSGPEGEGK